MAGTFIILFSGQHILWHFFHKKLKKISGNPKSTLFAFIRGIPAFPFRHSGILRFADLIWVPRTNPTKAKGQREENASGVAIFTVRRNSQRTPNSELRTRNSGTTPNSELRTPGTPNSELRSPNPAPNSELRNSVFFFFFFFLKKKKVYFLKVFGRYFRCGHSLWLKQYQLI